MLFIRVSSCLNVLLYKNNIASSLIIQQRNYAARKGTRERARKKKVKVEQKKIGFIPHKQRNINRVTYPKQAFDDSWKQISTDNVYPIKYYRWRVYEFAEAVKCHKETHDPTVYNEPNAPLSVQMEFNMSALTGDQTIRGVVAIPHKFTHNEQENRSILAFCKNKEEQEAARRAGAAEAGGGELIRAIQTGDFVLNSFKYIIAHPNILPELVALRGILRQRRFPNPKNGTLTSDIEAAVQRFAFGIDYIIQSDEHEPNFGQLITSIGTLDMDVQHLENNFKALFADILQRKNIKPETFISRCLLISPPSPEKLKINHNIYLPKETEEEEENEQTAAVV